ncbi:lysM and putative peptidoglycan-binding domain-containing protein 2-like [Saccoglossus kowalevskii]|uniref:LysM and putative peptidoglycan-binding domain-containing protein 2-like n=1 Tax=Saccoglossus kowalevskii TaxID=10224 RepID=A0ABM0LWA2_SACKO|nr:PREDICTED: lysM and putative peptidoglycan-binding domain-containing protein 2-like [Saccoglossus kowalevskii]
MAALEGSRSERQGLGITKKHYGRSYGSLQKSKQEIYIKHSVSETDTLQGIALKYGVTIEQIKRANKLFTTDSIFLRKVLNIPVGDQPLPAHLLENATASLNNGNDTTDTTPILQSTKDDSASESDKEGSDVIVESAIGVTVDAKTDSPAEVVDEEPRDETMDFFNRIDRHLKGHEN